MIEMSLNQATTRPYSLADTTAAASHVGIRHIGLWLEPVEAEGAQRTSTLLADHGLSVSSMCRAGFVADKEGSELKKAMDGIKRALELSHDVGAPALTFIAGGLPREDRDIAAAEGRVRQALEELEPFARQAGVRLALEPLHPLFVSSRSMVTTIGQALRIIDGLPRETVGLLVDAYATYWDPEFARSTLAAGSRIACYQVNDFKLPLPVPENMNGRLFPGDGEIDLRTMTDAVLNAGFDGPIEVEIFNDEIWRLPLQKIIDRTVATFNRSVAEPVNSLEATA